VLSSLYGRALVDDDLDQCLLAHRPWQASELFVLLDGKLQRYPRYDKRSLAEGTVPPNGKAGSTRPRYDKRSLAEGTVPPNGKAGSTRLNYRGAKVSSDSRN
jgi:hypothetical protein